MTDNEPTIPHKYLTSGSGQPLMLYRMTDEPCPMCGRGPKPAHLGILQEAAGQETLHCVSCDYQITRRPKPRFRPMNSGNSG